MSGRLAELEAAVAARPADPLARYALAKTLLELGQAEKAAGHFEHLVGVKPDWMKAWILLGEAHLSLGRTDEGRRALARALELAVAQRHQGPEAELRQQLATLGG